LAAGCGSVQLLDAGVGAAADEYVALAQFEIVIRVDMPLIVPPDRDNSDTGFGLDVEFGQRLAVVVGSSGDGRSDDRLLGFREGRPQGFGVTNILRENSGDIAGRMGGLDGGVDDLKDPDQSLGVVGSLGARLSSGLHQGIIKPKFELDERLSNAVIASFINGMTVSVFIAVLTFGLLVVFGQTGSLIQLVGIMIISGFLSAVLMLSVLVSVIMIGYQRGLDPDNIIGPVVTTLGDVFGVLFLLVGVYIMGLVV